METLGTQYVEAMISSLNYTLGRTSSAIVDRREVKIKPRGSNLYSPVGQRTIEFTLTDSASYLLLNTMKLQFRLQADDACCLAMGHNELLVGRISDRYSTAEIVRYG